MTNPSIPRDQLRFEIDGVAHAGLVFDLVAFTSSTTPDAAAGIAAAFSAFGAEHVSSFSYFQLNDSARARKFTAASRSMVPTWIKDPASLAQPLLGVEIHSGPSKDQLQPPAFSFFQNQRSNEPCGYIRLALPVESVSGIDDAAALLSMLEAYPVSWGIGGLSILWNPGGPEAREVKRWLRHHLNRYPGLGSGEPIEFMVRQHLGLMRVGWCTMVGAEHLETLGGLDGLREAAGEVDGLEVREFGDAAALFAGQAPSLGDVNRGELLPLQREAGRILEPIRAPRDAMEEVFLSPLQLDTADYLERFFVDPVAP